MALAAEFRHQLSLQFLNISKFAIADRTSQNVQNWHLKSGSILSSIFDVTAARFLVLFFTHCLVLRTTTKCIHIKIFEKREFLVVWSGSLDNVRLRAEFSSLLVLPLQSQNGLAFFNSFS